MSWNGPDPNRVPPEMFMEWKSQSLSLLISIFGANHTYSADFEKWAREGAKGFVGSGMGILTAAAEDCAKGYIWTLRERVHANVFDDYLEMAASLLSDGYMTAAAVIAGTTLEEHLRELCQKSGVKVNKKASVMNDDLLKQSVYPQTEWRLNQGWLDIRNDCAHKLSTAYDKAQIQQMIDGIRGFMARNLA